MKEKIITISKDEYTTAAAEIIAKMANDPRLTGLERSVIVLKYMMFADKLGTKLFDDKEDGK